MKDYNLIHLSIHSLIQSPIGAIIHSFNHPIMPTINFTYALKRFYPTLQQLEIPGSNVAEVLELIEQQYPGLKNYLLDDQGILRQHVNIFVNGTLIKDLEKQSDPLQPESEVYIMQALSGG